MKPFRKNLALAIDGGGIKGIMVARALEHLEEELAVPLHDRVRLVAGTSTGSIIAAGVAAGLDAARLTQLYRDLAGTIFRKSWRTLPVVEFLVRYRYSHEPLMTALFDHLGDVTMGELHEDKPDFHMVITATDVLANRTRFIKLYDALWADWRVRDVVMASSTIPTIFPVFRHPIDVARSQPSKESWIGEERWWVDGGVGSYENPCYLAAYEIAFCLEQWGWTPEDTTLLSFGTGNSPQQAVWDKRLRVSWLPSVKRTPDDLLGPEWALPAFESFAEQAIVQQVRLVRHFFSALDFRRYNVEFEEPIRTDAVDKVEALLAYGDKLGDMVLNDREEDVGSFGCGGEIRFRDRQDFSLSV